MAEKREKVLYCKTNSTCKLCGKEIEDQHHVINCKAQELVDLRTELPDVLEDLLSSEKSHPYLSSRILLISKGKQIKTTTC